jgi:tetratricopeptide (TPR) repeat protein
MIPGIHGKGKRKVDEGTQAFSTANGRESTLNSAIDSRLFAVAKTEPQERLHAAVSFIRFDAMSLNRMAILLLCLGFCGCFPPTESKVEEGKNPYFLEGKARVSARDYRGAIEAFEKALEVNPQSALAHYELGVLYEQHSEQADSDYINAMFHYQQVLRLRPQGHYPHDNARLRIASCKQELVRAESLAPVYYAMERELHKLRDENQLLKKQLDTIQASRAAVSRESTAEPRPVQPVRTDLTVAQNQTPSPLPSTERVTPLPSLSSARFHVVKEGETPSSIARLYRVRLDALLRANPSLNPKHMRAGQTLKLPSS